MFLHQKILARLQDSRKLTKNVQNHLKNFTPEKLHFQKCSQQFQNDINLFYIYLHHITFLGQLSRSGEKNISIIHEKEKKKASSIKILR